LPARALRTLHRDRSDETEPPTSGAAESLKLEGGGEDRVHDCAPRTSETPPGRPPTLAAEGESLGPEPQEQALLLDQTRVTPLAGNEAWVEALQRHLEAGLLRAVDGLIKL
jgi:hypothetical protein